MLLLPARIASRGSARCSHRASSSRSPPLPRVAEASIAGISTTSSASSESASVAVSAVDNASEHPSQPEPRDGTRIPSVSLGSSIHDRRLRSHPGPSPRSNRSNSSNSNSNSSRKNPGQYPFRTQRQKAGLGRADIGPSSPLRYWPSLDIPSDATQFECSYEALTGGPVTVGWTRDFVYVQDKRNNVGRRALKPLTIRDNCDCTRCRDPASGQKTFTTTELPLDLAIAGVRPTDQGLAVTWDNDIPRFAAAAAGAENGEPHETLVSWRAIELALRRTSMEDAILPRKRSIMRRTGVVYWDRDTLGPLVRRIDYADFMREDSDSTDSTDSRDSEGHGHSHVHYPAFWAAVIDLLRLGIVFLTNVPRDESSILRIVSRIANVRETFYGRTFDVRAKPAAENVAYTSAPLAPHQDLCYLEPQPMIQALHYLDNSCAGGESTFVDGERIGRLLYPFARSSPAMAPLADHHIPYHYAKHGHSYFSSRKVIDSNEGGYAGIYWSPPFQGRLLSPTRDIRPWIPPARVFEAMLTDDRALFTHKMHEGDCVIFDNQRVLHGRTAFHPAAGGARWLRGAYIAAEDFLSRAAHIPRGMAETLRGPRPWTPDLAQQQLKDSGWWHADALKRVLDIDPDFLSRRQEEEEEAQRLDHAQDA